jgi:hypothetical protein
VVEGLADKFHTSRFSQGPELRQKLRLGSLKMSEGHAGQQNGQPEITPEFPDLLVQDPGSGEVTTGGDLIQMGHGGVLVYICVGFPDIKEGVMPQAGRFMHLENQADGWHNQFGQSSLL